MKGGAATLDGLSLEGFSREPIPEAQNFTPGGGMVYKPVYTVQNPNATAGASVNSPASSITDTSTTPRTTPTLVQPKTTGGNHVLFIVLLLALVWFEWGRK